MTRGIVLVVIDCLRADHLSCYGYARPTTPTIDWLASHGTLWRNAYSTSSWTKPSVASFLTGLFPSQHAVLRGPKRSKGRAGLTTDVLGCAGPTVAEEFARAGWRCGAFLSNVQLEEYTRFNRGFGTYVPVCGKADRMLSLFQEWLSAGRGEPFFAYLHPIECHWPYKPRRRHVQMFGGDRDTSLFSEYSARDFARLRRSLARGETALSDAQLDDLVRLYDGAVRRLDGKIKILLRILEDRRILDQTAVLITADHGEEFLDHGSIGHGHSLFVEATHVPFVLWNAVARPAVETPVSLRDLPKTLLSLGGIYSRLPGADLLSAARCPSPAYAELSIGRSYLRCLRSGQWRLHRIVRWADRERASPSDLLRHATQKRAPSAEIAESVQLYDLASDAYEHRNLSFDPCHAQLIEEMTEQMRECVRMSDPPPGVAEIEVDERVVERLRALGYLE